MPIIKESGLGEILSKRQYGLGGKVKAITENRQFSKSESEVTVFLSHSHHDKDRVLEFKTIIEDLGIKVYVDWMDKTMPQNTCGETAQRIKKKIDENKKFVFLATNLAVSSKWCNWEVGIGDTYKSSKGNLAVLGMSDNMGHWEGNEYLRIYPSIEYEYGNRLNNKNQFIKEGLYVFSPRENGTRVYVPLEVWLTY